MPTSPQQHSALPSLEQKAHLKGVLQEELGWPREAKRPMICLPAGMTDALGGKLLEEILPGLLALQLEILVLGKGSATYGSLFTRLAKEHRHRLHIIPDKEGALNAMYGAADMVLFLSPSIPEAELNECLVNGVVPISLPHQSIEDYNPVQETGNAFTYEAADVWHSYAALVRAVETYKFPFDWKTIQRHCQESVRK